MSDQLKKSDAIKSINPDAMFVIRESGIEWHSDPISEDQITAKEIELQAEHDSQEYARNRQTEYPSIDDLVVAMWEGGVEERMASVTRLEGLRQAIKTKYPK